MANNITANVVDGVLDYNYTDKNAEKKQAKGTDLGYDQFLQLLAAEMQYQDPLEPTTNTEYVAQLATFSQLEATLSMQSTITDDMANSLVGKQVILTDTNETTGKTTTVTGNVDYVMYQDGKAYLSVNGSLYSIDTLDTVADDKYYEAKEMANTFAGMLGKLPHVDDIKSIYQGAVDDIRSFYDGMTDYQQKFVAASDLSSLEEYEKKIRELVNLDKSVAQTINDRIAAMPTEEEVTAEEAETVAAVRKAYNDLTASQQALISEDNVNKLTQLEARIAELTEANA